MAFSFGNTQQPAFGSTPAKATGFGAPFGTPATTSSGGFGFGSTFGANQQTSAFGTPAQSTAFGATSQPTGFGANTQQTGFGANTQQTGFGATTQPTGFGANTQQTGFGGATQSTGFGATTQQTSFGATTQQTGFGATTQPTGFGATAQPTGFGSSFGTPAIGSVAPTFGTSFGAPISSTAGFGSSFGATTTPAPAFGSSFGATSTPGGAGLFGSTPAKPSLFGATTSTAPSLFSTPASGTLFGNTAPTTNLFGGAASTAAPSLFGNTTTTTASSLFGAPFGTGTTGLFGSTNTASGTGLFGTNPTSTPSLFGGFGTGTGTGGFGTASTGTTGFSAFGTGTNFGQTAFGQSGMSQNLYTSSFGAKPAQALPTGPSADTQLQQTITSFYGVSIFNDERDDILKKWNILQASWGTGKGYFRPHQFSQYNCVNPFYRFIGAGYNIIIDSDNCEGLVKLSFNKKESEIRSNREMLFNGISSILGNRPNLTVVIDHIRSINDTQTDVRILVLEKGVTGNNRTIPASDLAAFLNNPAQKQQLTNVGVSSITAYVSPSKAEMEEYLSKPPPGVQPQMWEAAKADNPNSKKYMPIAINGFPDLKNRMHNQEYECGLHRAFLQRVSEDISELRKKHAASIAQITDLKQKFLQLQHRILRILVKQECTRKMGLTIQPEEEMLKGRLETLNAHLNTPTEFKGQLNELVSCVKTVGNTTWASNEHYKVDPQVEEDIKQFLQMEQGGISHLINIVNNDLQALKIISEGMNQFVQTKSNASRLL